MKRILLSGGRLIDPAQGIDGEFDLLPEDGIVARVAAPGILARTATAATAAGDDLEIEEFVQGEILHVDGHMHGGLTAIDGRPRFP